MSDEKPMGQVIQIDEARIRDHLGEMVRGTVEETLNAMLDAEADRLCGAGRYERSQAGRHPGWQLRSDAADQRRRGQSEDPPKLGRQTFETAIIERYDRRTRVVGAFPDGQSCLNLAAARLRYIAGTAWSAKCYMDMRPLYQPQVPQTEAVA